MWTFLNYSWCMFQPWSWPMNNNCQTTLAFDNNQTGGKTEYVSQIHQVSILSEASQNYQTWRSIRIVQFKAISENSNHLTTLHMLLWLEPVSWTSAVVLKASSLAPALVWRRLRTSMQQLPHPAARRKIYWQKLQVPRQNGSESVKMGIFVYIYIFVYITTLFE